MQPLECFDNLFGVFVCGEFICEHVDRKSAKQIDVVVSVHIWLPTNRAKVLRSPTINSNLINKTERKLYHTR